MASVLINRIGRKVQVALAGLVIASSLAVALPLSASAQGCNDFTNDNRVTIADVAFVVSHYRQEKPDNSGTFQMSDLMLTIIQATDRMAC